MKASGKIIVSLFAPLFLATFAAAQTNLYPYVQHVIIVIQENRTPDNLFNQDSQLIQNGGHVQPPNDQGPCNINNGQIALQSTLLWTCWDTDHNHMHPSMDWINMYDGGAMDGACKIAIEYASCDTNIACPPTQSGQYCPPYTYVENYAFDSTGQEHILDPYFQLANHYGWANDMFQTNQGASFPAHQFLLSGTSAPDAYNSDSCGYGYFCYQWFDAENGVNNGVLGCTSTSDNLWEIDPNTDLKTDEYQGIYNDGLPCYHHATLVDLLDNATPNPITWKYYARSTTGLWTAPNAIYNICQPTGGSNSYCNGPDWKNNVKAVMPCPGTGTYATDCAPILTDIQNCNLSNVSWVIPDGNWSDHAGQDNAPGDGGPSWVAAIVNQVAGASSCDNGTGYWNDTVILITWDDWGGYYDHVPPYSIGYPNSTGSQYVYGFRVPLLVVGAYVGPSGPAPRRTRARSPTSPTTSGVF